MPLSPFFVVVALLPNVLASNTIKRWQFLSREVSEFNARLIFPEQWLTQLLGSGPGCGKALECATVVRCIGSPEMPLGVARLAAGNLDANPVGSFNQTRIGFIHNDNEGSIQAIVKALPIKQLANELVAAVFLESLNLRAPRGYLVFAEEEDSFSDQAPIHSSGLRLYFGSAFIDHPIFLKQIKDDQVQAINFLVNYPEWGDIVGFDEWIANVDRHSHNLLYDGSNLIMFDHDRCLTGLNWQIVDWVPEASFDPHPFIPAVHALMPKDLRERAAKRAIQLADTISKIDIEKVLEGSHIAELGVEMQATLGPMRQFLVSRVAHIAKLTGARLSVGGLI